MAARSPSATRSDELDLPTLSEADAARLVGYSSKELGNMRREERIDRRLYRQSKKGGRVRYYREKFMEWAANKKKE